MSSATREKACWKWEFTALRRVTECSALRRQSYTALIREEFTALRRREFTALRRHETITGLLTTVTGASACTPIRPITPNTILVLGCRRIWAWLDFAGGGIATFTSIIGLLVCTGTLFLVGISCITTHPISPLLQSAVHRLLQAFDVAILSLDQSILAWDTTLIVAFDDHTIAFLQTFTEARTPRIPVTQRTINWFTALTLFDIAIRISDLLAFAEIPLTHSECGVISGSSRFGYCF